MIEKAKAIITLSVVLIILGVVAIPLVGVATSEVEKVGRNSDYINTYNHFEGNEIGSFSWTRNGNIITFTMGEGDEAVSHTYSVSHTVYSFITDKYVIRESKTGTSVWDFWTNKYANYHDVTNTRISVEYYGGDSTKVTILDGSAETPETVETWHREDGRISFLMVYAPDDDGDYTDFGEYNTAFGATIGSDVLFASFLDDDPAYLIKFRDGIPGDYVIPSTLHKGTTLSAGPVLSFEATYDIREANDTEYGYYSQLITSWTNADGTEETVTHFLAFAPIEYVSVGSTSQWSNLIMVIPVFLILGVLLAGVRMMRD